MEECKWCPIRGWYPIYKEIIQFNIEKKKPIKKYRGSE